MRDDLGSAKIIVTNFHGFKTTYFDHFADSKLHIRAALRDGETRTIDAGQVTFLDHNGKTVKRYFLNVSSVGLAADVNLDRDVLLEVQVLSAAELAFLRQTETLLARNFDQDGIVWSRP